MRESQAHAAALVAALLCVLLDVRAPRAAYDRDTALAISQGAIGARVGDHAFLDTQGHRVRLADYRGKPLVVSLVYTSCYHTCTVITRYLKSIVEVAREAVGEEAFSVVTVGFDAAADTPERMRGYASRQGVDLPGWAFLSTDAQTIERLTSELGFVFFPSPKGYDHLTQVTVLDGDGRVYRQIYGESFQAPALVEPLKELVFGNERLPTTLEGWIDNVRLFCTIYDPAVGRYRFDYSIFVGAIIGIVCLLSIAVFLVRAWRQGGSSRSAH
jgi:protein SCO1/2